MIMPDAYAAKEALIAGLCKPLLLDVSANGNPSHIHLPNNFQFVPLEQAPGFELARLLAVPGHTQTLLRGFEGAHSPSFSTPQTVRVEVLAGALLWWQESQGKKGDPAAYRRIEQRDVVYLDNNEAHSYVALMPCLTYNIFTPSLSEAA